MFHQQRHALPCLGVWAMGRMSGSRPGFQSGYSMSMKCPAASGGARKELSELHLLCPLHREERMKNQPLKPSRKMSFEGNRPCGTTLPRRPGTRSSP